MRDLIMFEANDEQLWIDRFATEYNCGSTAATRLSMKNLNKTDCNRLSKTYLTGLLFRCYN